MHVRAALTACASSEPHEPKHQAWAGSLLTSCNTFREYLVYRICAPVPPLSSTPSRQILSDFVPLKTRSTRDQVSHAACKDEFRHNPRSHTCRFSIFITRVYTPEYLEILYTSIIYQYYIPVLYTRSHTAVLILSVVYRPCIIYYIPGIYCNRYDTRY